MKKFFALGVLIVFPFLGTSWILLNEEAVKPFDDLGVKLVYFWVGDINMIAGVGKFLVIAKNDGTDFQILNGWIRYHLPEEQTFAILDKDQPPAFAKEKEGERIVARLGNNQDGNPIIVFYLCKKEYDESAREDIWVPESIIGYIDIKKFVEEHFKGGIK